jgi:hypothetical protein
VPFVHAAHVPLSQCNAPVAPEISFLRAHLAYSSAPPAPAVGTRTRFAT